MLLFCWVCMQGSGTTAPNRFFFEEQPRQHNPANNNKRDESQRNHTRLRVSCWSPNLVRKWWGGMTILLPHSVLLSLLILRHYGRVTIEVQNGAPKEYRTTTCFYLVVLRGIRAITIYKSRGSEKGTEIDPHDVRTGTQICRILDVCRSWSFLFCLLPVGVFCPTYPQHQRSGNRWLMEQHHGMDQSAFSEIGDQAPNEEDDTPVDVRNLDKIRKSSMRKLACKTSGDHGTHHSSPPATRGIIVLLNTKIPCKPREWAL